MADKQEQDELFPDFSFDGDNEDVADENESDDNDSGSEEGGESDKQEDLEKAELRKRIEQQDKRFDDIMTTMLRNQQTKNPEPVADQFKEMEVPNPVDDPDGFAKAVQHNADMRVKREIANVEARQRETENSSKIWSQFEAKYPELAKHEDIVEAVSGKIAKDMAAAGVDFRNYVATDPERFFDKVAERMNSLIAGFSGPGSADRTSGLVGSNGGKKPKKKEKSDDSDGDSLIDDLKSMQIKSGLY